MKITAKAPPRRAISDPVASVKEKLSKAAKAVGKPGLEQIKRLVHNESAARNVKGAIQDTLKLVKFAGPLSKADSPRQGPNGQMAPNGDPLIRVKLSDGPVLGQSQYAWRGRWPLV